MRSVTELSELEEVDVPNGTFNVVKNEAQPSLQTEEASIEHTPNAKRPVLLNDDQRAEYFVDNYLDRIRYVPEMESWFCWQDHRWVKDTDGKVTRLAREFAQDLIQDKRVKNALTAMKLKDAKDKEKDHETTTRFGDVKFIRPMLELACVDDRIILHANKLDADPWLVGVQNGVIELKTGTFRVGRREDNITKSLGTTWDDKAACPRFGRFLTEIFPNSPDTISFVQRMLGYTLTADIREHAFFFLYGTGANGKSCLVNTIYRLMGDYGKPIAPEVVIQSRSRATPDHHLAELQGLRFATLPETEDSSRMAESRVKQIVAGDPITACRKYEHPMTFNPCAKLWIHGNYQPDIRGVDDGIWRRVHQIHFGVSFPKDKQDPNLEESLLAELPGILRFAVEGCLNWQIVGLNPPQSVLDVTAEYREEQDTFGRFIEEELAKAPENKISRSELYGMYKKWAEEQGEYIMSNRAVVKQLKSRGFEEKKSSNRYWLGLCSRVSAQFLNPVD